MATTTRSIVHQRSGPGRPATCRCRRRPGPAGAARWPSSRPRPRPSRSGPVAGSPPSASTAAASTSRTGELTDSGAASASGTDAPYPRARTPARGRPEARSPQSSPGWAADVAKRGAPATQRAATVTKGPPRAAEAHQHLARPAVEDRVAPAGAREGADQPHGGTRHSATTCPATCSTTTLPPRLRGRRRDRHRRARRGGRSRRGRRRTTRRARASVCPARCAGSDVRRPAPAATR